MENFHKAFNFLVINVCELFKFYSLISAIMLDAMSPSQLLLRESIRQTIKFTKVSHYAIKISV